MQNLINQINLEFEGGKGITEVDVKKLQEVMEAYQSDEQDWSKYAMFDQRKYTRNLVDAGNGNYNLIVLCWGPGQSSPIHDHANSHCLFKCLDGELTETRFRFPESSKEMETISENTYTKNQVNYMSNQIGLHKVANNGSRPSVSLHLYSPPILECKTFCQDTGVERASGRICFHSKFGRKSSLTTSSQCQSLQAPESTKSEFPSSLGPGPVPSSIPSSIYSRPGHSISYSVGTAESLYSFKMGSADSLARKYSNSNNDSSLRKRSIDTTEVPKAVVEVKEVVTPKPPVPVKKRSIFWG